MAGRLEWRLPDPSCNVYLAIAGTLIAGLDGIDQGLVPPTPCDEDLYVRKASGLAMPERLPRSLDEALAAFKADAALQAGMGTEFCDLFSALKQQEWDAYQQHVSDWELAHYADAF